MPSFIDLVPQTTASTNPFGITFGSVASCELIQEPEVIINKSIGSIDLDYVNEAGLIVSKGTLTALIPWQNIIVLIY